MVDVPLAPTKRRPSKRKRDEGDLKYGTVEGLDKPISKLVLGSTLLSTDRQDESNAILDTFFELGGNAVDTAHCYGPKTSGALGTWMQSRGTRKETVVYDKGCHPYGSPRLTVEDLRSDLAENLERLRTDHVDLWVFHRDDPDTPLEQIMRELNDQKAAGTMHAFGGSNWSIPRIEEANRVAASLGLQGFSLNNPNLSLATVNEPMWDGCVTIDLAGREWHARTQFPLFAWSSMGGGFFAGGESPDITRVYLNNENLRRRERLREMAERKSVKPVQLALAWTWSQPFPVWALVGCATPSEVRDAIAALEIEVTPEESRWLEGI